MKNNSTTMSRLMLPGLGVLVVGLLVALVWNLRGDALESRGSSEGKDLSTSHQASPGEDRARSRQAERDHGGTPGDPGESSGESGDPSRGTPADHRAPGSPGPRGDETTRGDEPAGGETEGTTFREYRRADGVVVRDHRAGDHSVDLTRAIPRAPGHAKLQSRTVLEVHNALRPTVDRCATEVDRSGFGDKPRVRVDAIVAVSGENLAVEQVAVVTADIPDEATQALSGCIQGPAQELSIAVPGEEDLSSYTLTLPFQLRRR